MARACVWLLVSIVAAGCNEDRQVPFGLDREEATPAPMPMDDPQHPASPETPDAVPSTSFEPGSTVEMSLGARTLVLDEGHVLAVMEVDLNADDLKDGLFVRAVGDVRSLEFALARGEGFERRRIDAFRAPVDCEVTGATIGRPEPSIGVASVMHRCESGPREDHWVVSLEATPRPRERVTLLPRDDSPVSVSFSAEDVDQDQHLDAIATFNVAGTTVQIPWLDRPSGFARDTSQPESSIVALADAAQAATSTREAIRLATQALAVFENLCRESGKAAVGLSGTTGMRCGQSKGASSAAVTLIKANIVEGRFMRALEATAWLKHDGVASDPATQDAVSSTWRKATVPPSLTWKTIASSRAVPSRMFFEGDATLQVRGRESFSVDLESGKRSSEAADAFIAVDPLQRHAIKAMRQTCKGVEADFVDLHSPQARPRRTLLVKEPRRPCSAVGRGETTSWEIVGWAPQGVVLAQGPVMQVVPLDVEGRPIGDAYPVTANTQLPAPLQGGPVTTSGSHQVLPTAHGLILRRLGADGRSLWIRPADWDAVAGSVESLAISPSARRIAIKKGAEIRLITW